jgi:hypothetical protein
VRLQIRFKILSTFLIACCALSCGAAQSAVKPRKTSTEVELTKNVGLPRSSELVARVYVARLRESSLFTAFLSLLNVEGLLKRYAQVEKACGASPAKVIDEIAIARGAFGWVAITRVRLPDETVLECGEKTLGGTRSKHGVRGETLRLQFESDTLVLGTPTGVQAATDAAPTDAPPLRTGENTVFALSGDIADMTLDANIDATPATLRAHARIRFPSADHATQIYERVSKARTSALDNAERSLAKDVLKSIKLELRGSSLDVELGIDGDIPVQQRYLDVLLGLYEAFRNAEK